MYRWAVRTTTCRARPAYFVEENFKGETMVGVYLLCALVGAILLVTDLAAAIHAWMPVDYIQGFGALGLLLLGGSALLTTEW